MNDDNKNNDIPDRECEVFDVDRLVRCSISPSWFVRNARVYKVWCKITVCNKCGVRAKYEDQHPVNPCMRCGDTVMENVGRWI